LKVRASGHLTEEAGAAQQDQTADDCNTQPSFAIHSSLSLENGGFAVP
jgi:hypothetical protein